jgi:hypothetical protein
MQKEFVWERVLTELIRSAWEAKARVRYADKLTKLKAKGKGKLPENVDQVVWDRWQLEWAREDFKQKSDQTRRNRHGGDAGAAKHTGGSVSYDTHYDRLVSIISAIISIVYIYIYIYIYIFSSLNIYTNFV